LIKKISNTTEDTNANYTKAKYYLKIAVVGPTGSGKSSLLLRYIEDTFRPSFLPTIGVEFYKKAVKCSSDTVQLLFWDTSGQERFRDINSEYYRGCTAAIVVVDVTNESTLELEVRKWRRELEQHTVDIPVMLIANKADLLSSDIKVPDLETISKGNEFVKWALTSAKTNVGIDEAMRFLVNTVITTIQENEPDKDSMQLVNLTAPTKKKVNCCN